jgi:transposase
LAEKVAARTQTVKPFQRKRPARKPFPDHLPRERVVVAAPESCPCCGSRKLSKLGEDVTETLEVIPRQWKVIQTVREKFSCRDCETISQPPAPFHVTPRGFAGPNLLAMILFEKFGQHQPLNRQSERYAREGILSTLADQVGACATVLRPLHALIGRHVLSAGRLHGDDTTVPILAKGQTIKGHIWTYVRDDRPFGGRGPPAALYYASRDRRYEHPARHLHGFTGILQADAYSGYNALYEASRAQGPVTSALCWALCEQRARLSNASAVAKPIDYMLRRWERFARFIDDGRICLTNNAAERALRGFALGRKSWLFAGSERGADRAAVMATLIMTAKLNGEDPQAWLADVLARINDHPIHRLDELLPWNWRKPMPSRAEAA